MAVSRVQDTLGCTLQLALNDFRMKSFCDNVSVSLRERVWLYKTLTTKDPMARVLYIAVLNEYLFLTLFNIF